MNKKLIALIIGGLIVIAAIIYFIFIYNYNNGETPGTNVTNEQPEAPAVVSTSTPEAIPGADRTAEEKTRDDASQLSLSFAERYGSSSNQSNFTNLEDLEVFMTPAMQGRTESYIAAERQKPGATDYEGITTKAIVADLTAINENEASVTVKTRRVTTKADGSTSTADQDLKLMLKKLNGDWKVDSADWAK